MARLDKFCHLLSRPNVIETFNHRVSHLKASRKIDEGLPQIENQMITKFSSWRQRLSDVNLKEFQPGDSAVLVPLVSLGQDQNPHVLFTHRSYKLRKHRGEISCPGGKIDEGETIEQAAIREANEEIGLNENDITIYGKLPAMLTRFNTNIITPVVGKIEEKALSDLLIQTDEVQSIFLVPLSELTNVRYTAFRMGSKIYRMPVFLPRQFQLLQKSDDAYLCPDKQYKIWGLTGGILNELLASLLTEDCYDYVP